MSVSIDGVEYVPVTGKRVNVDGVVYAELVLQQPAFNRIVDKDDDTWYPTGNPDQWHMTVGSGYVKTREGIERAYGISREYNA